MKWAISYTQPYLSNKFMADDTSQSLNTFVENKAKQRGETFQTLRDDVFLGAFLSNIFKFGASENNTKQKLLFTVFYIWKM